MAVDLKIKSNTKQVSKKFKKFESVLPRIIDKGVKQAGFQLLDITVNKLLAIFSLTLIMHQFLSFLNKIKLQ